MAHTFRLAAAYKFPRDPRKRPPLPAWLHPDREVGTKYTSLLISYKYWSKLYWATPPWLTEAMIEEMKAIYRKAEDGEHVDHIVPLKGRTVSGLHVPWNLQVIQDTQNYQKSNNHWPDMWNEQNELPIPVFEGGVPCEGNSQKKNRRLCAPIQETMSFLWARHPEASLEEREGENPQKDLPL